MKKFIAAGFAVLMAASLIGCKDADKQSTSEEPETSTLDEVIETETEDAEETESPSSEAEETEPVTENPGQSFAGKTMVVYTWADMFPQEVIDGFMGETGAQVILSNFLTDEEMLTRLQQSEGGEYDVVIADDYILELAIQEGLAQELDKKQIPNIDNVNSRFQGQFYDPEDAYTIPYGAGVPLIMYNPDTVDLDIKGYNDLWDPSLNGRIALISNYRVIDGITLLSMGKSMNTENLEEIQAAGDKLLELAPNVRLIQDDNTQNALLTGEADVAFLYTSQVNMALTENPDLKVVVPEEGVGYGVMAGFIPSQASESELAHAFLNYLLRPEVSAKCFEYIGYYCTTKAAEPLISEEWQERLVIPEDMTGEMIQNISAEALDLHEEIWTAFRSAAGQ